MTVKNRTNTEKEIVLSPHKELFFCLSVTQLYPLFALHAEDQNIGFQGAGLETTTGRDIICPSVSKVLYLIIFEPLQIVRREWNK